MALHRIQQFILAQLSENDALRYRDMRPRSMEASQFMYHLHVLENQNLVHKLPAGEYSLTATGKLYVDRADNDNFSLRAQPRIGALIVCRHPEKGLLYVRRALQPARGHVGFPIIDIPLGFPLPLTRYASDAFALLSGLRVSLAHRADGYLNLLHGEELEGSLLAHVFTGQLVEGELSPRSMHDFLWEKDLRPTDGLFIKSNSFLLDQLAAHQDEFFFFDHAFDSA